MSIEIDRSLRGRAPGPSDAREALVTGDEIEDEFWLPGEDLNLEIQDQNLLCCQLHHRVTDFTTSTYKSTPGSSRASKRGPRREPEPGGSGSV